MHHAIRAAVVGCVFAVGSAHAAVDYFLKVDTINGDATDKAHKGWSDVDTFAWGVSSSGGGSPGSGGGVGKPVFDPLTWTQSIDSSSVGMFLAVASGKHYKTATLDVQTITSKPFVFFEMSFADALITGYDISGSGITPKAAGALSYSKVTMKYWKQDATGAVLPPIVGTFTLNGRSNASFDGDASVFTGLALAESGFAPALAPVPEPATWALMAAGLAATGFGARRASARRPRAAQPLCPSVALRSRRCAA